MWKSQYKTPLNKVTINVSLIRVVNLLLSGGTTLSSSCLCACLNTEIWYSRSLKCKLSMSHSLQQQIGNSIENPNSGMKACVACTSILQTTRRTFGPHLRVVINGNSREICSSDRFVWLSAICRNVDIAAAERGPRVCRTQCRQPTASLQMHPVSVWVPEVTNRNSGEIGPK